MPTYAAQPVWYKDPDAKEPYSILWDQELTELGGVTIASSVWTVPAGITQVTATNDTTKATIVLSGGTAGQDYQIVNRITTTGAAYILDQTITIKVRSA
jgi:hypothetical protein